MGVVAAVVAGTAVTLADVAVTAGVVGAALSVAGSVTHNKTLSEIGMGVGAAGLVGGLGAAVGGVSAMTVEDAAGSLFSSSPAETSVLAGPGLAGPTSATQGVSSFGEQTMPSAIPDTTTNMYGSTPNTVDNMSPDFVKPSYPWESTPVSPMAADTSAGNIPIASTGGQPNFTAPGASPDVNLSEGAYQVGGTGKPPTDLGPMSAGAEPPSVDGATKSAFANQTAVPSSGEMTQADYQSLARGDQNAIQKAASGWQNLDGHTKMAIALAAAQAGGGVISGMFQAMSASSRLDFEKMVNAQQLAIQHTQLDRATASPGIINFPRSGAVQSQTSPTAPIAGTSKVLGGLTT